MDSSRTWLGSESTLAQLGWGICGFQHSMDELSGGATAEHGQVISSHQHSMDVLFVPIPRRWMGLKVGTSTASMGYQCVNYPAWMGFQWNARGESLECLGAFPNDTPWTVPESLSWSIVAPLMSHQFTSVTAMNVPPILFNWEQVYGPLLKIESKIYDIIVVKKLDQIRFNSDARGNYLWAWASSNNRIK